MEDSIKDQVKEQFSRNAQKFVDSPRHARGEDLVQLVATSGADKTMSVLDIATGGGHVANALAPLVNKVTACDLTEDMLKTAAVFINGNGHSNVEYVVGDAEALPFADASYELVTCRIAAHHFPNVPAFVSEAYRVLKPGGKLLLIDNVAPEADHLDLFYNEIEKKRDPSHARAWKKSSWLNVLELTGFRVESMIEHTKTFDFSDWCERTEVVGVEKVALETFIVQAPLDVHNYFSIRISEAGELLSFNGASAYFQAIRNDRVQ